MRAAHAEAVARFPTRSRSSASTGRRWRTSRGGAARIRRDGATCWRGDAAARWSGTSARRTWRAAGEGAPLVPFFHFACARRIGATAPVAFLNLGGVGNVTWVDPRAAAPEAAGALVAFDTGPGNALIDDFLRARLGRDYDADGAVAAAGRRRRRRAGRARGASLLCEDAAEVAGSATTSTAFSTGWRICRPRTAPRRWRALTAACVAEAARHFPEPPERWLVCGGGRLNRTLMAMLAARTQRAGRAGGGGRARRRPAGGAGLRLSRGAGAARAADLGARRPPARGCRSSGGRISRP